MTTSRSLTEEEVLALPEGTPITVIWSGGNGPHEYWLHRDELGIYADLRLADLPKTYNPLTFIGVERFHTRVWVKDSE